MEKWEKILRHELEALVPDGGYIIGEGKQKAKTGRMGYIDFRVALCKKLFFEEREKKIDVCPLCDGKGKREFKNCTPPISETCPACNGKGKLNK